MGSAMLNANGVATISALFGHAGPHAIIAQYGGTAAFAASASGPLTQTVNLAVTTTTLTSSLNPSVVGQSVKFMASVTSTSGTPGGTITFTNNGTVMGSAILNASGLATVTVAFGHPGSHIITATYAGNADFARSNSPTLTQTATP